MSGVFPNEVPRVLREHRDRIRALEAVPAGPLLDVLGVLGYDAPDTLTLEFRRGLRTSGGTPVVDLNYVQDFSPSLRANNIPLTRITSIGHYVRLNQLVVMRMRFLWDADDGGADPTVGTGAWGITNIPIAAFPNDAIGEWVASARLILANTITIPGKAVYLTPFVESETFPPVNPTDIDILLQYINGAPSGDVYLFGPGPTVIAGIPIGEAGLTIAGGGLFGAIMDVDLIFFTDAPSAADGWL